MRLISWNVNGLRAVLNKGFIDIFQELNADIFCLQETKMQPGQAEIELPGYTQYWNSAEKKGYSGTAVFTRIAPISVTYGIGLEEFDHEGRLITLEFEDFYLVNCYTPNAQRGLARLGFRMSWEDALRDYLMALDITKPVVYTGDLNVAHQEIDLKNPKSNRGNAGFSDEERGKMSELLDAGFVDTYRALYPQQPGASSWWSHMYHARANNAGWRIDYFIVSRRLLPLVTDALILPQVQGSDHCPVGLELQEAATLATV